MSKPAAFFLQFIGLCVLVAGWLATPMDAANIGIGITLVIVGGVGYRRRVRRQAN